MTIKRAKKKPPVEGTVVSIPYGDGKNAYAQLLPRGWIRVFAPSENQTPPDPARIVASPELFRVSMHPKLALSGRWPVVGHAAIQPEAQRIPDQFVQDLVDPANVRIHSATPDGGESVRRATIEEAEGLPVLSVWDPVHVEQRLADRDAGVPNLNLLALRLVRLGDAFTILIDRGRDASGHWVVSGKAHAEIRTGDRLRLGSDEGPLLTVAATTQYAGEGALPSLSPPLSGALHLAGDVPPEARSERVLRCAESALPSAGRKP